MIKKTIATAPGARTGKAAALRRSLLAVAAVVAMVVPSAVYSQDPGTPVAASAERPAARPRFADFGKARPSRDARHVADWIADSGDNLGGDFIIIDKKDATVYVFDSVAHLRGSAPVLLGAARGDHSVPGIGERPLSQVRAHEKTTPAGRFVAERGRNTRGEDVVWVDYDSAVSMHRVRSASARERRLERLATPTASDNRISYGCINVPAAFYESHVRPIFATQRAMVYVLPEMTPAQEVFGSYDVAARRVVYR